MIAKLIALAVSGAALCWAALIISAWIGEQGQRVTHIGLLGLGAAAILIIFSVSVVIGSLTK